MELNLYHFKKIATDVANKVLLAVLYTRYSILDMPGLPGPDERKNFTLKPVRT